jgi:hypothetical protein
MDMKMSPMNFKEQLEERILDLHWKQWAAFGVSSQLNPSREFILDLEALVISTLTISKLDHRLFEAALEWTSSNRRWLNLYRLKRISKFFTSSQVQQGKALLNNFLSDTYISFTKKPGTIRDEWMSNLHVSDQENYFIESFYNFKKRGIVVEPDLKSLCLLQLYVRNFFGVDARAEMFLYFLADRKGNSNSISSEIFLEQKNLYRILKDWVETGIIEEDLEASSPDYRLKNRDLWLNTFRINETPAYMNWSRIFKFMDSVFAYLDEHTIEDDTYLASSFFRDTYPEAQYAASVTKTDLPAPKAYPGKEYFGPFADAVLQIAEKITM